MKKYKISYNWNPGGPYDFGYKSNFTIEIEANSFRDTRNKIIEYVGDKIQSYSKEGINE